MDTRKLAFPVPLFTGRTAGLLLSRAAWRPSSRPPNTELGGMDELAAAAAVVAMSIDDDSEEDSELQLEDSPGASAADGSPMPDLEATGADKENKDGPPMVQKVGAEVRKMTLRLRMLVGLAQLPPDTLCSHPAAHRRK